MGSLRFTVGTVVRIINLKHYKGRISFLPAGDNPDGGDHTGTATATATTPREPFRMPSLAEQLPLAEDSGDEQAAAERWTSVEGDFVLADATQVKSNQITSHHITSHHISPHHITSHYTTSHHNHITPHHTTSHHTTSHHTTSHHITPHHITPHRISSQGMASRDMILSMGPPAPPAAVSALCITGEDNAAVPLDFEIRTKLCVVVFYVPLQHRRVAGSVCTARTRWTGAPQG